MKERGDCGACFCTPMHCLDTGVERGYMYGPRMDSMVGGSGFQDFHGGGFLEPRVGGKWPERSCVDGWLLPWFLIQDNPRGRWPKVSRDRGDKRATGVRCCKVSEAGAWRLEPETKTSCHALLPQRLNPGKPRMLISVSTFLPHCLCYLRSCWPLCPPPL